MAFGKGVRPGVYGTNPDVSRNNVSMQFDYRQVYANILKDWMLVDEQVIANDIFFGNFINGVDESGVPYTPLPIARQQITSNEAFFNDRFGMDDAYPNPAHSNTTIRFRINAGADVQLALYNLQGRLVKSLLNERKEPGEHTVAVNLDDVPAGIYVYQIKGGLLNESKKLVVRK